MCNITTLIEIQVFLEVIYTNIWRNSRELLKLKPKLLYLCSIVLTGRIQFTQLKYTVIIWNFSYYMEITARSGKDIV